MKYGQIPFPAVSFCNLNPFRLDKLPPDDLLEIKFIESTYASMQKEDGNVIFTWIQDC